MKAVVVTCVLLAACGAAPSVGVSVVAHGLTAAEVALVDLYLLDASAPTRAKDCAALGTGLIATREDVDVFSRQQLGAGVTASFKGIGDGKWLLVGEAYADATGLGARTGFGCVALPPIYRDETTKVTLTLEALP
ncbi:MAG: hypothetical protein IT381_06135 [Deltaproteobacteria bacterium]|nr:hypothetical protein [Deltaproteobacteria bacterium]